MHKPAYMFILIIMCFSLHNCTKDLSPVNDKPKQQTRALTQNETQIVESGKTFGLKLFKKIVEEQPDSNIFISPLSVSMALGMTLNGADGGTYEAMRQTLEFNNLTNQEINESYQSLIELFINLDQKVLFEIANSIWYRNSFQVEQPFLDTNQAYFDAEISALDFNDPASVNIINNWVSDNTHEKIKKIIDNIYPASVMFLINAIYFRGSWSYEFDADATQIKPFHKKDGSLINCKMMQTRNAFDYYEDDEVQIVDLPYGAGDFSMTILLPKQQVELNSFIGNLEENRWQNYLTAMQSDSGNLKLPKFKVEYKLKMNDVLSAMGMAVAFSPEQADFTRINKQGGLFISKVLHKTFVQVDEEGTEAAAATVVEIKNTSVEPQQGFTMVVNRPFIYVIRERNSQSILFIGKMEAPEWTE